MSYQQRGTPRESVPQNDQGDGETNVRHREMRSLPRVLVPPAEDRYCPEGCQKIHQEAGEVCDIFIPDSERKELNTCSQIATWSIICYYLVLYGMITLLAWGERRMTVLSCKHSKEVTRRDSSWLTGIKATQRYLTNPPPAILFTKTGGGVLVLQWTSFWGAQLAKGWEPLL